MKLLSLIILKKKSKENLPSNAWSWAESELQVERCNQREREQEQEGAGEPAEEA